MPPALLFDLSKIDLNAEPIFGKEDILKVNAQRYELQQLDAILWYDKERLYILGYKEVTENEFWIRGHIPGRPIMPGVIMEDNSILAAGGVTIKNSLLQKNKIYGGNPAKEITVTKKNTKQ